MVISAESCKSQSSLIHVNYLRMLSYSIEGHCIPQATSLRIIAPLHAPWLCAHHVIIRWCLRNKLRVCLVMFIACALINIFLNRKYIILWVARVLFGEIVKKNRANYGSLWRLHM